MRKVSILVLAVLVAVIAFSCGKKVQEPLTEAPFFTTLEEAKLAAADGRPMLLDFWSDT